MKRKKNTDPLFMKKPGKIVCYHCINPHRGNKKRTWRYKHNIIWNATKFYVEQPVELRYHL